MNGDIEDEINRFYARYAINEGISFIEAKKKIDAVDVQMFQQKAKQYVENKDFSDKANAELRAYNTKMYVSRKVTTSTVRTYCHICLCTDRTIYV